MVILNPEAATQRSSWEKVFWKYATNLQESTHAEGAAYFQNTFSKEHLWVAVSVNRLGNCWIGKLVLT